MLPVTKYFDMPSMNLVYRLFCGDSLAGSEITPPSLRDIVTSFRLP